MTTPSMPLAYCKMVWGSFSSQSIDDNARDDSEYGSPRVRARTTKVRSRVQYRLTLTSLADAAAFDTFVSDTIQTTLIPFVWTNTLTNETLTMRLDEPPQKTAVTPTSFTYSLAMSEV